jgi:hypothetical protein
MPDNTTRVDVLSLEDFNKTLATRLSEAEALLTKLNTDLKGKSPKLGTFEDGTNSAEHYSDLYTQYVQRIGRLKSAIVAAQAATNDIIANYKTTEARNHASAADIANKLGGVYTALNTEGQTGA